MQINLTASEKKKLINVIKNDPILHGLMTATYQQIDNWIDNNVTDLASAMEVFKRLVKIVVYLIRHLEHE